VVFFRGRGEELAGGCGVTDRGGRADAEYDGQVEWVGSVGEGFVELPVDAELFECGCEPAEGLGHPFLAMTGSFGPTMTA